MSPVAKLSINSTRCVRLQSRRTGSSKTCSLEPRKSWRETKRLKTNATRKSELDTPRSRDSAKRKKNKLKKSKSATRSSKKRFARWKKRTGNS